MLKEFEKALEEIEKKRAAWIYANRNNNSNYTIRALNTIKNLEQLPISAISPKPILFIDNY